METSRKSQRRRYVMSPPLPQGDLCERTTSSQAHEQSQRSSEATLAPSFASLQLKKLELEFAVDPLFKKASADFDEGGAKGLLLNHLMIDSQGRIVFDSSDDAGSGPASKPRRRDEANGDEDGDEDETDVSIAQPEEPEDEEDIEIDLSFPWCSVLLRP